jgi:CBS domain-containing protein
VSDPEPDSIVKQVLRPVDPISADETIAQAAATVIESGLPALPAVEANGAFAGIFGEREFMAALFPGYVGELASARMVSRSMDEAIDRRIECAVEPIRPYLTTDLVVVGENFSDTEMAELFLHHRVLIVPVETNGQIHAVVTRHDFFEMLMDRFIGRVEEADGDD